MYTVRILYVYCTYTVRLLYVYCTFTVRLLYVYCVFVGQQALPASQPVKQASSLREEPAVGRADLLATAPHVGDATPNERLG